MNIETHKVFARIILRRFGVLEDPKLVNWAVLPDKKYKYDSFFGKVLLHRWSLHGPDNIGAAIEIGRQSSLVTYSDESHSVIKCLLMSHSYLDLFNFVLHPSRPNKFTFTWIPEQLHRFFTLRTLKDPDGVAELMERMAGAFKSPEALTHGMLTEYRQLPAVGVWMRRFLNLYDKGDKNVEEFSN